jgi:hypothetical protein
VKKLEDRYRGPFKIIAISDNHKYTLEDVLGEKIEVVIVPRKLVD